MTVVNTHEAKTNLSRLLERVDKGEEIVIAKANRPVARLIPYGGKPKRRAGFLKGKLKIAEDFDAPLPEEILRSFEASE